MEERKYKANNDFDAEKVMNMSKKEAISFLGPENAAKVTEGLKNGTLSYSDFQKICQESFPTPQQAILVRNVIFNQLSESECFNMFESNKGKQETYARMAALKDKAQKGELTKDDLKELCDTVFGKDSDLSKHIQDEFIKAGRIKQDEPKQKTPGHQAITDRKKTWDLDPDEKVEIQRKTAEIGRKYEEQQKQDSSRDMQQGEIQQPVQQPPTQDIGDMEL